MTRWTLPAAVVVLACLASALLPATPRQRTSGDEPHYLITALSLAEDADLNVANQYADDAYRPFHSPSLRPQGRTLADGRVVEPHDPLLPALLAGPVALGGWRGAKAAMAALAGAAAALVAFTLTRHLGAPPLGAGLVVIALLGTAPFAVYGSQIYPEVPAALAVAAALLAACGPPTPWRSAVSAAAVIALPWLSVKHVPVAAVLAAALLHRAWRHGRRRQAALVTVMLLVAGIGYVVAHLDWYGGATVYAAGRFFAAHGGQASVLGTNPDVVGRATRLAGLLVDRHFGLAAWQPAWLLAVPAAVAFVRRRPTGWAATTAVLVTGWLNATFAAATMHGFWFPGRHVVAVLPAAALVVGWWTVGSWTAGARARRVAAAVIAGFGGLSFVALLAAGAAGQASAVFFPVHALPWRGAWPWLLPDYMRAATVDWVLHGAWTAVLAGLAVVGWRSAEGAARPLDKTAGRPFNAELK